MNRSIIRTADRVVWGVALAVVALCLGIGAFHAVPVSVQAPGQFHFQVDDSLATAPHTESQA